MIMKNFKNEKIQEANRYIKELVYQSAHLENKEITYAETINTIEYYKEAIKKDTIWKSGNYWWIKKGIWIYYSTCEFERNARRKRYSTNQ